MPSITDFGSEDRIGQSCPPNDPTTEVDVEDYTESFPVPNLLGGNNKARLPPQQQQQQQPLEKDGVANTTRAAVRPPTTNNPLLVLHPDPTLPVASLVRQVTEHSEEYEDDQLEAQQAQRRLYQLSPATGTPPLPTATSLPHPSNSTSNPNNSVHSNNLMDAPVTVVVATTTTAGLAQSNPNHHHHPNRSRRGSKGVGEALPPQLTDFLENRNVQRALGGFLCGAIALGILVVVIVLKSSQTNTTPQPEDAEPFLPDPLTTTATVTATTPTVVVLDPSPPLEPTAHPTLQPPTLAPTAPPPLIVHGLSDETKRALRNPSSPQSRAYAWLQNHTQLEKLETFQKQQMMGFLSLYYALDGDESFWSSDGASPQGTDWLSYDVPFCEWTPFQPYPQDRDTAIASSSSVNAAAAAAAQDENHDNLLGRCNEEGQFVRLNLHHIVNDRRHRGTRIPPEIGLLHHLETLEMNHCQFDDDSNQLEQFLPTALQELTNLQELLYVGNNFKGTIPPSLPRRVPHLRSLNLDQNALKGSIPSQIGTLDRLSYLSLSWNSLQELIPSEIGRLQSQLETVRLYKNRLVGPIPSEIALLTQLSVLELQYNDISGTLPPSLCTSSHALSRLTSSLGLDCHQLPCPVGCRCTCS